MNEFCNFMNLVSYRMCRKFRLTKRDDYFQDIFDHFLKNFSLSRLLLSTLYIYFRSRRCWRNHRSMIHSLQRVVWYQFQKNHAECWIHLKYIQFYKFNIINPFQKLSSFLSCTNGWFEIDYRWCCWRCCLTCPTTVRT